MDGRADGAHALGGRMRRIVEARRVLHRPYDRLRPHTRFGRLDVGVQQGVHGGFLVIEKAVSRLDLGPARAGLRDIRLRSGIKIARKRQQACLQPGIRQRTAAKFFLRPVDRNGLRGAGLDRTVRREGACLENRLPIWLQRIDPDILDGDRPGMTAILPAPSLGLAEQDPVGSPVTGAAVATAIHKSFYEHGGDAIAGLPVRGQSGEGQTQHMRGQIGYVDIG